MCGISMFTSCVAKRARDARSVSAGLLNSLKKSSRISSHLCQLEYMHYAPFSQNSIFNLQIYSFLSSHDLWNELYSKLPNAKRILIISNHKAKYHEIFTNDHKLYERNPVFNCTGKFTKTPENDFFQLKQIIVIFMMFFK